MTKEEVKKHYEELIEKTESSFQKNILNAEMEHQLKMIDQGITPDFTPGDDCLFCGS